MEQIKKKTSDKIENSKSSLNEDEMLWKSTLNFFSLLLTAGNLLLMLRNIRPGFWQADVDADAAVILGLTVRSSLTSNCMKLHTNILSSRRDKTVSFQLNLHNRSEVIYPDLVSLIYKKRQNSAGNQSAKKVARGMRSEEMNCDSTECNTIK
uniref:Uncharacterized protein n=1 Tax=Glossina pallidipes TaxID=7398 RepID=A0A1A9ZGR4_GLOPL